MLQHSQNSTAIDIPRNHSGSVLHIEDLPEDANSLSIQTNFKELFQEGGHAMTEFIHVQHENVAYVKFKDENCKYVIYYMVHTLQSISIPYTHGHILVSQRVVLHVGLTFLLHILIKYKNTNCNSIIVYTVVYRTQRHHMLKSWLLDCIQWHSIFVKVVCNTMSHFLGLRTTARVFLRSNQALFNSSLCQCV